MSRAISDPARGIVRVEGGTVWEPAVDAAAAHGRAVLHGSSPDVGIAGYSLGGGIGWYARKLGLATNSLTAVELVIGDGTLVRADADENPALFWALRGGGGSFGVVTALEFRSYPIETAYAGMLVWDAGRRGARAARVERLGARARRTRSPRRSGSCACRRCPTCRRSSGDARWSSSTARCSARTTTAPRCCAGLRALRPSSTRSRGCRPRRWSGCTWTPRARRRSSRTRAMLGSLPDAARRRVPREAGPDATTSLLLAELRQLGGALGRPHEGGGVLSHLDGQFVAFAGRDRGDAGDGASRGTPTPRAHRGARAVGQRPAVPQLRGEPRSTPGRPTPTAWRQLAGIRSRGRPARDVRGQPPGPAALRGGLARPDAPEGRPLAEPLGAPRQADDPLPR